MSLKETFQKAQSDGFALGAFNVSTLAQIKAVVAAAEVSNAPVILEISPGEAEFLGIETLTAMRKSIPARDDTAVEIFLNLDHAKNLEDIKRALEAGFDLVHFDGSELPFAENIQRTKEVAETVHREGVLVEGEIDQAGGHSILKGGVGGKISTDPEKAAQFVSETGVDILACFFGNLHGVYGEELRLDLEHLSKIKKSVESVSASVGSACPEFGRRVFFSMHGGSGVREEDIRKAVKGGIVKVNVNTELRMAWAEALRRSLAENPNEVVPYKLLAPVVDAVREVVEEKISLLAT